MRRGAPSLPRPARRMALLAGALALAAPAAAQPLKPHLVPLLPDTRNPGQHAPIFVDPLEHPGRILYRFDSVISNTGGALDLLAVAPSGARRRNPVGQVLWNLGVPDALPQDPNAAPAGDPNALLEDRSAVAPGATILYWPEPGHHHWHFLQANAYTLLVPGQRPRGSGKVVGFCMVDSYGPIRPGAPSYFPEGWHGADPNPAHTWCQESQSPRDGNPDPPLVRMGISPGWGDYYESQDAGQWIDVTGLRPGRYTLISRVNPKGYIDVSPPVGGDEVVRRRRLIPGVIAADAAARVAPGGVVRIRLRAHDVGPAIPARISRRGSCADGRLTPVTPLAACYRSARAGGPLRYTILGRPAHGTASIRSRGSSAILTYRTRPGALGGQRLRFRATDVRGLTSLPATVRITVG